MKKNLKTKIQKFGGDYKRKKSVNENKKKIVLYYLGNIDGNSGKKLNSFFIKNLKS